ncbi:MAG: hypothetical protein COU46_02575 [Candidatus Niyogibacteria bacterium CG10_big_fil_rev_8_21_14_0_10_42_19]|uniref:Dihydrolipoamide acetyltransferase component of pyruvate dehydrogenase complex n=1 Tax=Candidatus Niyogibacteria bacterium CG10_big_fil_rev_8_21_14_0_10_42_19 TaxID=1974725 RepID=A0A2H0TFB1_9BACT|nr:MAG: hypothetical protein COU46_02575 [Candidatus Niyogibacteria bacterium CG10_big_fil_rev_8_21_14_0_10_42_19]
MKIRQPIYPVFSGQSVFEIQVVEWKKNVGDSVEKDEVIVEIYDNKVSVELAAPCSGILVEISKPAGSTAKTPREDQEPEALGYVETEVSENEKDKVDNRVKDADKSNSAAEPDIDTHPILEEEVVADTERKIFITPLAKIIAKEKGIDISKVRGTGPGGRITRKDLEIFISQNKNSDHAIEERVKEKDAGVTPIPVKQEMSRDMPDVNAREMNVFDTERARRFDVSNTIPRAAIYLDDVDFHEYFKAKEELNKRLSGQGPIKVSPFHIVIWAGLLALNVKDESGERKFARFNSSFSGYSDNGLKGRWSEFSAVNLGFSVDPGNDLRILVVNNADSKSLSAIIREMAEKTNRFLSTGRLLPGDVGNSTIVFNNPGAFGIDGGLQIIGVEKSGIGEYRPHVVIVGLTKIKNSLTVKTLSDRSNAIVTSPTARLEMSFDHRMLGGRMAAEYMKTIKKLIEDPEFYSGIQ